MADVVDPPESSPWALKWTREECARLEAAGFLSGRYELVEGNINRMGQNMPHANVVRLCLRALFELFGDEFVVTQASIDVRPEDNSTNEPMPDLIVLSRPAGQFAGYPLPHEIRLLVEVADTTLNFDLTTKARLYARAGIREYWVASVNDRNVTVHRRPEDGRYCEIALHSAADEIASLALPEKSVRIAQLFGSSG